MNVNLLLILIVLAVILDLLIPGSRAKRSKHYSPPYDSNGAYDPELARQINDPPYSNHSSDDDYYRNEDETYTDIYRSTWDD